MTLTSPACPVAETLPVEVEQKIKAIPDVNNAKVEITCYYKGGTTLAATASDADKLSKQRYYTFRYTFQSNGTKTF